MRSVAWRLLNSCEKKVGTSEVLVTVVWDTNDDQINLDCSRIDSEACR